jgi:hypothetical protein
MREEGFVMQDVRTARRVVSAILQKGLGGTFTFVEVGNERVDYLVLNYDTLIEDALALESR